MRKIIFLIILLFLIGCKEKEREKKDIFEDEIDIHFPEFEEILKEDFLEIDKFIEDKKEEIKDIKDVFEAKDIKEAFEEEKIFEEIEKDILLEEITKKIPVGEPCGEGLGECVEGASCIEVEEGSAEKKCYEDKEKGEPCGPGIGACKEPFSCKESEEEQKFKCFAIAKVGEECGIENTQCEEGLICKGEEKKICYILIPEGGFCEGPFDLCQEGFVCTESSAADGYKKKCLKEAKEGEVCGYGIAECVSGTKCNWDGPEHKNAFCYPSLKEGDFCEGYQIGPCPENTACVMEKPSGLIYKCIAEKKEGEDCGAGFGKCEEGLSCNFIDALFNEKKCYKNLKIGEDCTQFIGIGFCEEGSICNWTDDFKIQAKCFGTLKIGDECAKPATGPCPKNSDCIWADETKTKAVCIASATPVGEECGIFGKGLCVSGSQCIVTSPAKISAKCYKDQPVNGECGAGIGLCEKGAGCIITDTANLKGKCLPSQPLGFECGIGKGGCEEGKSYCVCSNPFVEPQNCQKFICVPQDLTYFDTCIIGNEWVGLCPDDAGCSLSSTTDFPLKFKCYPLKIEGEECGVGVGFCAEGLECVCNIENKKKCTNEELFQGKKGVCMKI